MECAEPPKQPVPSFAGFYENADRVYMCFGENGASIGHAIEQAN
jgi:hypothetical protein